METVSSTQKSEFQFDLTGGQLALDLANTVSRRDDPQRRKDHLKSYLDVVSLLRQSKVIAEKQAHGLREFALQHPAEAGRSFAKVVKLREAVYRVFSAVAQHKSVAPDDLKLINHCAIEALRHRALAPLDGGYSWQWVSGASHPLDWAVWPAAKAAADLLTSDQLRTVRFCEAPDCQWLFLDRSRNRSRRWCDMTSCGNRAKARRHYRRAHE
jgi:predicted RNA-binding Zn ribbon-like protein